MTLTSIYSSITKSEWRFVAVVTLAVMILSVVPLVSDALTLPSGNYYLARKLIAPDDQSVYFSYIEQVKSGAFLLKNLFVIEPGQIPLFNMVWLSVGWITKILNLPAWVGFHLVRLMLIPIFAGVSYGFISYFFKLINLRRLAFFLLLGSAGWGFLSVQNFSLYPQNFYAGAPQWPLDLWVSESNTFSMLYFSPHFAASILFFVLTVFLLLLAWDNNQWRYSFGAGLSALALFSFHPFNIIPLVVVLGLYGLYLVFNHRQFWRYAKHYALVGLVSAPAVFYYWYLVNYDWLTQIRTAQNLTPMTPIGNTLLGYLPLLLFSLAGMWWLKKHRQLNARYAFLIIWVAAQFIIVYLPIPWQRRMVEGLHIPLALLAALGLAFVIERWPRLKRANFLLQIALLTLIFSLTPITRVSLDSELIEAKAGYLYIDEHEAEAMLWLKDQKTINNVRVMSNFDTGTIIAGLAGVTVYAGHVVETPNALDKKNNIASFYSGNLSPDEQRRLLNQHNITFVFYGRREKAIGSFDPSQAPFLKLVFSNDQTEVYAVL